MLTALFFLLAFATIGTLIWAGIQLLQVEENPLADRLQVRLALAPPVFPRYREIVFQREYSFARRLYLVYCLSPDLGHAVEEADPHSASPLRCGFHV